METLECPVEGNWGGLTYTLRSRISINNLLVYYEGSAMIAINADPEEACFVRVDEPTVHAIHRCSTIISHGWIMEPLGFIQVTINHQIEHLICYERFVGCVSSPNILDSLRQDPNLVPENPPIGLITTLLGWIDALRTMHLKGLSSTWLGLPEGYVKCAKSGKIKILRIDTVVENVDNVVVTNAQTTDISDLMNVVGQHLFTDDFHSKTSFLDCFNRRNERHLRMLPHQFLEMIEQHPCLKVDIWDAMEFFPVALYGQKKNITEMYNGRPLVRVWKALPRLLPQQWSNTMNPKFKKAYNKEIGPIRKANKAPKKEPDNAYDFMDFLRNTLGHIYDQDDSMTLRDFLVGIKSNWPSIIDDCYTQLYTY